MSFVPRGSFSSKQHTLELEDQLIHQKQIVGQKTMVNKIPRVVFSQIPPTIPPLIEKKLNSARHKNDQPINITAEIRKQSEGTYIAFKEEIGKTLGGNGHFGIYVKVTPGENPSQQIYAILH